MDDLSPTIHQPEELAFSIRPLSAGDAGILSSMLRAQRPEYARFFYAFGFNEPEIAKVLEAKRKDVYSGIFWREELAGFFMLRGWDEGYEVPSFGIIVDEKYRGALLKISLEAAKLICRLSGSRRMMSTIHPDNVSIKGAARLGFVDTGKRTEAGNVVYHMEL